MATDLYKTDISFDLQPTLSSRPPRVKIRLDSEMIWEGELSTPESVALSRLLQSGAHALDIELHDKSAMDADQNLKISNLCFGQIHSHEFVWQAIYRPDYPEPWASQQRQQGIVLPAQVQHIDCLGWNGVWSLAFSVPIFTWVHQTQNLGWIYD